MFSPRVLDGETSPVNLRIKNSPYCITKLLLGVTFSLLNCQTRCIFLLLRTPHLFFSAVYNKKQIEAIVINI